MSPSGLSASNQSTYIDTILRIGQSFFGVLSHAAGPCPTQSNYLFAHAPYIAPLCPADARFAASAACARLAMSLSRPVDDRRRVDLYLSGASSGLISSIVGSAAAPVDVGALAEAVFYALDKRARDRGRVASIFYACISVQGSYDESLDAILQARGGGIALFLLTQHFFGDARCVEELLRFLHVEDVADNGEHVEFRFVSIGLSPEELLRDPRVQPYAHYLRKYRIHSIALSTLPAMTDDIAKVAVDAWLHPSTPNVLGATLQDTLYDLLKLIPEQDTPIAASVLRVEDSGAIQLRSVLSRALESHTLGTGDDSGLLDEIVTLGSGLGTDAKRMAVEAFKRKWELSGRWEWGGKVREQLRGITTSTPQTPLSRTIQPPISTAGVQDITMFKPPIRQRLSAPSHTPTRRRPPEGLPSNPDGVVLDYSDAETMEGKLKSVLLEAASASGLVVAVCGMGGVGKTCALRGLSHLPEIYEAFPDGVFFTLLGKDANVQDVINGLAVIMAKRNDLERAERIRECKRLKDAVDIAKFALSGVQCMFLFDDLWPTLSCGTEYLKDLQCLLECCGSSCLVFSTKDWRMAKSLSHRAVSFQKRNEETSKRILLSYSGFTDEDVKKMSAEAAEALTEALGRCAGLPIGLAITGRAVHRVAQDLPGTAARSQAWTLYKSRIKQHYALCKDGSHDGLSAAFLQSIEEVDRRLGDGEHVLKYSAAEMYRSLCVLQKQLWAPFSMLRALWGLDADQVKDVVESFEELNLLEVEFRDVGGSVPGSSMMDGVKLHDLALDFCHQQVRRHKEGAKKWHALLLSGYLPHKSPFETRAWWAEPNDGYLHHQLTRHLLGCRAFEETTKLLLDWRWIMVQLQTSNFWFVMQDFERTTNSLKEPYARGDDGSRHPLLPVIELISSALGMSWSGMCANAQLIFGKLAFQIIGRLSRFRAQSEVIAQFLDSVEENTPAPWLRPLSQCLSPPNPALQISIWVGGKVCAAAWIRHNRVVAVGARGLLRILDTATFQTAHELIGHKGIVRCAAVLGAGSAAVVVSGGDDGTLRFWNAETGAPTGRLIQASDGSVKAVAVSRDGKFVVSGSEANGGEVKRWGVESRVEEGQLVVEGEGLGAVYAVSISADGRLVAAGTKRGCIWLWNMDGGAMSEQVSGVKLGAHESKVTALAITANGRLVVSGGFDKTIRLWSVHEKSLAREPIRADDWVLSLCTIGNDQVCYGMWGDVRVLDLQTGRRRKQLQRAHTEKVHGLDVTADGTQLVSSGDDGYVRVWDLHAMARENEWAISGTSTLHGRGSNVKCIAMSADRQWIVTGHRSGTLHFWDAKTGEENGVALLGHLEAVGCVSMSADNRLFVSGSDDRTVRVWDVHSRREVFGSPYRHDGKVHAVAISADGSLVVSGGSDKAVRVWCTETGAEVFKPLQGHGSDIRSVALSPNGKWIVSGSEDHDVRVWNLRTGAAVGEPLRWHTSCVNHVAVTADSQSIVSRGDDVQLIVWRIETGERQRVVELRDPHYHSSLDTLMVSGGRATGDSSVGLSMSYSQRSRTVYEGDPSQHNVLAAFDLDVHPSKWVYIQGDTKRLWAVLKDGSIAIVELKSAECQSFDTGLV